MAKKSKPEQEKKRKKPPLLTGLRWMFWSGIIDEDRYWELLVTEKNNDKQDG